MPTKAEAETFGGVTYHIDGELVPVLTVDEKDFRVYRRNGREVIPIVCPPRG